MEESFTCQCCGHCCEGRGGIVVSPIDLDRLCRHLELTPQAFEEAYAERRNGKLHVRAGDNGQCCFFIPGTGCAVHLAKPNICRAWPYFRGNLIDAASLELAKEFCPGIPKSISLEEFSGQGVLYLHQMNLIENTPKNGANALDVSDLLALLPKTDT